MAMRTMTVNGAMQKLYLTRPRSYLYLLWCCNNLLSGNLLNENLLNLLNENVKGIHYCRSVSKNLFIIQIAQQEFVELICVLALNGT
ncbi:hypothetical protein A2U01_0003732 [Trifolium medium]|uniref:Uncharacterized protein n=1 Tax=Trifolium medium TaxID=97028 RepID=A0A392M6Q7_9FABA|nr:hypothetical protein [Trifolium medium]